MAAPPRRPPAGPDRAASVPYLEYRDGAAAEARGAVIDEAPVCIFVNGQELATLLCSPTDLEDLAVGFAFSAGVIDAMSDIEVMSVSAGMTCVDLWLRDRAFVPPTRRIITSGCGGGVTFDDAGDVRARYEPLGSWVMVAASRISRLMQECLRPGDSAAGGHTSALSDGESLVLVARDVGRHNTIDRLAGQALRRGVPTEGAILLTSGRVSSEMLAKAARMRAPVVVSRTTPTRLAVELAAAWNVTLVGYARGSAFRAYAAPERIAPA